MTGPAGNPDYISDGMRPEEYEPFRRARRQVYLHADRHLDALAGYFARIHLATAQAFIRNILDPFRNFDFRSAEQGILDFGAENDPHRFYAEQLGTMRDMMRELQRLDLPYWFPAGYADITGNAP